MCGPRTAPDARPESDQPSPPTFARARLLPAPDNVRLNRWDRDEPDLLDDLPLVKRPVAGDVSFAQIVQSIFERNRMMARTKRRRRSYGAGEWGRNRVRVFPDAKTGLQMEWRENGRRLTRSLKHRNGRIGLQDDPSHARTHRELDPP